MSLLDKKGFIWIDGEYTSWADAGTHILTHTLHYGSGVFEGVRAYSTEKGVAIFRLQDHTDRLFRSAKILNMKVPFTKQEINEAHIGVIQKNTLSSCYIRPMVFHGAEHLAVSTKTLSQHVMVGAWEWGAYLGEENVNRGVRICTSSFSRQNPQAAFLKAKANGNYLNSVLALQEAQANGFDETLLLDSQGFIAEGSAENIFLVRNGVLYTPTLTSALEGITRESVMTLAKDLGIEVVEKQMTRDEVYIADEAFFTGTAVEVTPIRQIDNRDIGSGTRGEITQKLQSLYSDVVRGKVPAYEHWLTYVK